MLDDRFSCRLRFGVAAAFALCLSACSVFERDWLDRAVEAASSPGAMWYRVQFEADYGDEPVHIDQMVTCTTAVVSGGWLGQSPDTVVREAYPKTAGVDLSDGSRVVVRLPDMCNRNRKFEVVDGLSEKRRGWESVGSFDVMPLVIWSERPDDPERVESYISRAYYEHPEARFKNARGTLTLWEVGRTPENVRDILAAPPFEPFEPNPWLDPERVDGLSKEDFLRGYGRDGRYHGKGPRYAAYTVTEIDSVEEWWEKYQEYSALAEFLLQRQDGKPEPDPRLETDEVSVWPTATIIGGRRVGDPDFIYATCPGEYIDDLMLGIPRMSDLPFNSQDGKSLISGVTISEDGPYEPDYKDKDWRLLAMQWRACAERAAQTRTFDIIDGRFDASQAIPGVLVYRKWGNDFHEGGTIFRIPALSDGGVYVVGPPPQWRHAIDGVQFGTSSYWNPPIAVEIKPNSKWVLLSHFGLFYKGRLENSKF